MRRFSSKDRKVRPTYFTEDLTAASSEPQSPAAAQAKRQGLVYVGFGRYEDPRTQQVTAIVQNDRLVPFSKAVRTNSYTQNNGNDIGNYVKSLAPIHKETHNMLSASYPPEKFGEDELDAIKAFTADPSQINQALSNLPAGIDAGDIQPVSADDNTSQMVAALDSAMTRGKTPNNVLVYTAMPNDMEIKPGDAFSSKGYRSTTISLGTLMPTLQGNKAVLQIMVPKGSKGIYADDYSSNPGEGEFIMPRGSKITITGGPTKLRGTVDSQDTSIVYYTAEMSKV